MSLNNGKISDLKIVSRNGDKKDRNFPIQINCFKQMAIDATYGAYDEWVVAANGFIIAHFVDETSLASYMNYLKQFGFKLFPKTIMDILEKQYNSGALKREG